MKIAKTALLFFPVIAFMCVNYATAQDDVPTQADASGNIQGSVQDGGAHATVHGQTDVIVQDNTQANQSKYTGEMPYQGQPQTYSQGSYQGNSTQYGYSQPMSGGVYTSNRGCGCGSTAYGQPAYSNNAYASTYPVNTNSVPSYGHGTDYGHNHGYNCCPTTPDPCCHPRRGLFRRFQR